LRFTALDVSNIRVVAVNEAVLSGLMNWWCNVMLDGLMGKVNSGWHDDVPGKKMLRDVTTSNDEALLYYVLCDVEASNNWSYAFDQAEKLVEEDEMNKFVPLKQVQSAIKKIISKENKQQSKYNSFAEVRVENNFAPIVGHVKTSRGTKNGKDWD
jgi:hypothetical protein